MVVGEERASWEPRLSVGSRLADYAYVSSMHVVLSCRVFVGGGVRVLWCMQWCTCWWTDVSHFALQLSVRFRMQATA